MSFGLQKNEAALVKISVDDVDVVDALLLLIFETTKVRNCQKTVKKKT